MLQHVQIVAQTKQIIYNVILLSVLRKNYAISLLRVFIAIVVYMTHNLN